MKTKRLIPLAAAILICWLIPQAAALQETPAPAPAEKEWMPPPAPIEGKWKFVGCEEAEGMVISFTVKDDPQPRDPEKPYIRQIQKKASAKVLEVGNAAVMKYQKGDVIFEELAPNYAGNWRGKFKWRSALGEVRMDPVYLTMEGDNLVAAMTTSPCFRVMERVP
ncbi:MAG: hypothetical protein GX146_02575 [Myxococcales bacterium]|jgi:hypothetical protein|nr:hypothetical protein [Myxococcales bacterium]